MPVDQELDLAFVDDDSLREVVGEYWSQAAKAYSAGSYVGAIVASGAVVEGLLTWALLQRDDEALKSGKAGKDKLGELRPIRDWYLNNLIQVAIELGLVGNTAKDASWAVQDFRNFIHPYNVLKQSARPDEPLAISAMAAVQEIARSLKGNLCK